MPKRRPNAVKALTGSRHLNTSAPAAPLAGSDHAPRGWLTPEGRRIYKKLAGDLRAAGLLKTIDIPALTMLAQAMAFNLDAAHQLGEEGQIVAGAKGSRKNPAWQTWRDSGLIALRLMRQFGMTPATFGTVDAAPAGADAMAA